MKKREETVYEFVHPDKEKQVLLVKEDGICTFLHIGKTEGKRFITYLALSIEKVSKKGITAHCYTLSEKPIEMYLKWNEISIVEK